jgi:hypothetical protein
MQLQQRLLSRNVISRTLQRNEQKLKLNKNLHGMHFWFWFFSLLAALVAWRQECVSTLQAVCKRRKHIIRLILPVRGWRPPLWSSGHSSWLQIRRTGFDSQHYQNKKKVVCLEWGPLSLVSTTEELLDRKVAAPV